MHCKNHEIWTLAIWSWCSLVTALSRSRVPSLSLTMTFLAAVIILDLDAPRKSRPTARTSTILAKERHSVRV